MSKKIKKGKKRNKKLLTNYTCTVTYTFREYDRTFTVNEDGKELDIVFNSLDEINQHYSLPVDPADWVDLTGEELILAESELPELYKTLTTREPYKGVLVSIDVKDTYKDETSTQSTVAVGKVSLNKVKASLHNRYQDRATKTNVVPLAKKYLEHYKYIINKPVLVNSTELLEIDFTISKAHK